MVLKKDRQQMDQSRETRRNITHSQRRHTTEKRKANWISHILRRKCLLKHVIQRKIKEKIQVTGKRRKQLLNSPKETTEYIN